MTGPAVFDSNRTDRIGLPEAVLADGKSDEDLITILTSLREEGTPALVTRLTPAAHSALPPSLRTAMDYDALSSTGYLGETAPIDPGFGSVAVVAAGTSDRALAAEVTRTLQFLGIPSTVFTDLGVAGLWRFLERRDEIAAHTVTVLVAGMEGALFSVAGGLLPGPVIAVPSPVGYGVSSGGRTALDSALASCAPGVVVVNIGNGYGAACAAARILLGTRSAAKGEP